MKKIKTIAGIFIGIMAFICLTACSSPASDLTTPDEEYAFQISVSEEYIEKMPYVFSGENNGWEIMLQVREATEEEKNIFLQQLDINKTIADENYSINHTITEEQYNMFIQQIDKQKADISEHDVYISTLAGQYLGEEIKITDEVLIYNMINKDDKVIFTGGVAVNSLSGTWYLSHNTLSGDYSTGIFVPPLEGCSLILQYDDTEIEIPLTLQLNDI